MIVRWSVSLKELYQTTMRWHELSHEHYLRMSLGGSLQELYLRMHLGGSLQELNLKMN